MKVWGHSTLVIVVASLQPEPEVAKVEPQINKPALPPGQAIVGGVQRPASDVLLNKDVAKPGAKEPPKKPHGFAPPVSPDTNEQTKLVAASLQAKDKPERYSSFVTPNDFDKAAFEADPKGYATKYASGRFAPDGAIHIPLVVINPEFEVSFTISDAAGRIVMSGKLDNYTGTPNNLLTWSCQAHDTVTAVAGFGNCLESRSIDALGNNQEPCGWCW